MLNKGTDKLGCNGCRPCSKIRSCEECPLNERVVEVTDEVGFRCCDECPPLRELRDRKYYAIDDMKFAPLTRGDFSDSPELNDIRALVNLGAMYTCSARAARAFQDVHGPDGRNFDRLPVSSFEEGVEILGERPDTALLVPHLHEVQKRLESDGRFVELASQAFRLPNPALMVARRRGIVDRQRVLFTLKALDPLVREVYGGRLPFRDVAYVASTTSAAEHCAKIYGGGYCVANEMQLDPFHLTPVRGRTLPQVDVTWRLYRRVV